MGYRFGVWVYFGNLVALLGVCIVYLSRLDDF